MLISNNVSKILSKTYPLKLYCYAVHVNHKTPQQALANETLNELTAEEVFLRRLAEESLDDKEKEQRLLVLFRQSYDALRAELEGNS